MGDNGVQVDGKERTSGRSALLTAVREQCDASLRDVRVLDRDSHDALFVRPDVRERLDDVALDRYLDNERLGYLSHDTYEGLHYAEFRYTVRGFDCFTQFRTFLRDGEERIGVLVGVDAGTDTDFDALFERIAAVAEEFGTASLTP